VPYVIYKVIRIWKCNSDYNKCTLYCEVNKCSYCMRRALENSGPDITPCLGDCRLGCNEKYN
jgi:hypothetical protein